MKKLICFILLVFLNINLYSIIIYRPYNNEDMNSVPCYLKILDEQGNDVTYKNTRASFAWYDQPKWLYAYKNKYYLLGGQIMHLGLEKGIYYFQFYTPKEKTYPFNYLRKEFNSNSFKYNTESKLNVIFVSPTADDDYFYNGGWYIDYKAPDFFNQTYPKYIPDNNK